MRSSRIRLASLASLVACTSCSHATEDAGVSAAALEDTPRHVVYGDALENGWFDASWDAGADFAHGGTQHSGSSAISADLAPWGGLMLGHTPMDTSPYKRLRLYANGGDTAGKAIEVFVKLPGNGNGAFIDLGSRCDGGSIPANAWVRCEIPLADLGAAGRIAGIVLQEWRGLALSRTYFDDIELVVDGSDPTPAPAPPPTTGQAPTGVPRNAGGSFRGDADAMPAFGGWAWGNTPADAVARAGFAWFETGYPGDVETNRILRDAGVRPFAYVNLGELVPDLEGPSGYDGPRLRYNGDWGTYLVDVTNTSWQDWLVRRASFAYDTGSRGIKWDVATPDIPPGKSRSDVNDAIAAVMRRVLEGHPDFKFIFNQGAEFGLAHPEYIGGMETEGLFSASSYPAAWLKPWLDPFYWGPQYEQMKQIHGMGIPIFVAEYVDPASSQARELYDAITGQGFVPYITSVSWNIRGWGYGVQPGW
jgi:hypothetical protein